METNTELCSLVKIGLVLNIIGTLIVALSFGKNLEEAHQLDEKGRKIHLASFLHPTLFYWGLAIIIIGFILQVMA